MSDTARHIVEYFEEQAKKFPRHTAVTTGEGGLTYHGLNGRANTLAHEIISRGDAPPAPVCLLLGHDAGMVAAVMAVLKAGHIYVPLDPAFPRQRLTDIVTDARPTLLLTDDFHLEQARALVSETGLDIHIIDIHQTADNAGEDNPGIPIDPRQTAYIMYTSGTTGKPKGVTQDHRSIVHFMKAYSELLQLDDTDRTAVVTSYSHTVSAIDIFSTLFNGGAVCLYNVKTEGEMDTFIDWLTAAGITIYHSVPTLYRYLTDTALQAGNGLLADSSIRLVILGGEEVLKSDVERYKSCFPGDSVLVNLFGASEILVATAFLADKDSTFNHTAMPIGYPIDGVEILLLDEHNKETPVLGTGELVYRCDFLSPGYWNREDKTRQVFVPDPLTGEGRVYRGGDLGRMLPDGSIEHLGRKDFQIKIRGHRIELNEIEALLDQLAGVAKSVVRASKNKKGEYELAAYYTTPDQEAKDSDELRRFLAGKLPVYMAPAYIVHLDRLPLTATGKVDRNALPLPGPGAIQQVEYVPPTDEIQEQLVLIWQDILDAEPIGIHHDFSLLGGHSLDATKLISRVHKQFEVELTLGDILKNQTIAALSRIIRDKQEEQLKIERLLDEIEQSDT
jgi:amino acid adenylation domain-containing protein